MGKSKINNFIEYSSLALVFSYLFAHNIVPVLIGITFALYLLNINTLNKFVKSIKMLLDNSNINSEHNKEYSCLELIPTNIKTNENEATMTLAEKIEELGFIPSLDVIDDKNTD